VGHGRAFFTIGVVVEVMGPYASKNGKQYSMIKVTDLVKYDMNKVKRHLEA
jgi:rRNA processing protein Gar1